MKHFGDIFLFLRSRLARKPTSSMVDRKDFDTGEEMNREVSKM